MNVHFFTLYTVCLGLLLLSVSIRPSPWRWMFWPLIIGIDCGCYYVFWVTGDKISLGNTENSSLIGVIFISSDFILLTNVQQELRLVGQKEPVSNSGIWARLKWGLQLLVSGRGVGWAHEPRSVLPPHPTLTRTQFVLSRFGRLVAYTLIYDLINILFLKDFLSSDERIGKLAWRSWAISFFAISARIIVTGPHLVCSMICVGSGLSEPTVWPHLFGKWSDAYTVRRFWG
jgi:hypothetical protein